MSSNLTASAKSIGIKRARGDRWPFLQKSLPKLLGEWLLDSWRDKKAARIENPCVGGSMPPQAIKISKPLSADF